MLLFWILAYLIMGTLTAAFAVRARIDKEAPLLTILIWPVYWVLISIVIVIFFGEHLNKLLLRFFWKG